MNGPATVLVVDDSATNRALLARVLQKHEHQVVEAANGAEALGLTQVRRPDLIITDVLMPKVDGYELERHLRADPTTARIPLVFYTAAYDAGEVLAMIGEHPNRRVLTKPSSIEVILKTAATLLAQHDGDEQGTAETPGEHRHVALLNDKLLQKVRELKVADRERRLLLKQLVQVQEDERERIAGEIHDDPIQAMTAVAMRLEMLGRTLTDPESVQRHATLRDTVQVAIARLRHLLFQLHPPTLNDEGLAAALDLYLAHSAADVLEHHRVEDRLATRLPPDRRALLYRIAQEAIMNVIKHADARSVTIVLEPVDDGVQLTVRDDGRGFDVDAALVPRHGHLGLRSMHQRAALVGGRVRVTSGVDQGTTVEVWLPDGEETTS